MVGTGVCPKCRQPLETDESEHLLCGRTVQWRCQSCGKVSEGFAFPYGMCPHCGGSLRVLERAGVSDEASLNAIRTAFQIELGGKAFYERAADQVADPVLKGLFTKFSAMEHEHMETLSRRYHVQLPDPAEGFRVDIAAIQAGVEGDIADPETLFRTAITFEKRAVDFFSKRANAVPEGSAEQDLYKELAAEEVEHVALLETEFQRWSKGRAGMLASESRSDRRIEVSGSRSIIGAPVRLAKGPDWALLHFDETSRHDDESKRDPHAGDLYVFRGRSGSLIKISVTGQVGRQR